MSQQVNDNHGRGSPFSGGRRSGILGSAVRKVAGGIGLASESITAYKEDKKAKKQTSANEPSNDLRISSASSTDNLEVAAHNDEQRREDDLTESQWEYDEAQSELEHAYNEDFDFSTSERPPLPPSVIGTEEEVAAAFIQGHDYQHGANHQSSARLEMPVILAQRRPKDRTRGFVRGYAPMLDNVGIDQTTWFNFLNTFDESTRASPWIKAINLANIPGMLVPIGPAIAISIAIDITIKAAQNTQTKQKCNKFLDEVNKKFFMPKGLFCLVMTWRPDSGKSYEEVSMASTVASSMDSYSSGTANKFKSSSGKTYGDFNFPEAAPLIFPKLEAEKIAAEQASGFKQSMGKKKDFVDNYYDKRAQSEFAHGNPDNLLNQQQQPQYTSRYADPNHPTNSGTLISLVSGGIVNPPTLRQGLGSRGRGGLRGGLGRRGGRGEGEGAGRASSLLPIKPVSAARNFILKQDVLYLMVVNMPTEDELRQARNAQS